MEVNGYEKRTNQKRESIINAARALFTARGVQDVTVGEIAKLAKVSQVSIYNYFGGKKALAKEIFISYVETAIDQYEQIMEEQIPFAEKLKLIMQNKHETVAQLASFHFNYQFLGDKDLHQIFQEALREKTTALYQNFIERGKLEGVIDKGIPTEAIMSYLMMSMTVFQNPDFLTTSNTYKMGMINLFLYGIVGSNPSAASPDR